jgi:hypothetical protein
MAWISRISWPRPAKGGQLRCRHDALVRYVHQPRPVGRRASSDHRNGAAAPPPPRSRYGDSLRARPFHPKRHFQGVEVGKAAERGRSVPVAST